MRAALAALAALALVPSAAAATFTLELSAPATATYGAQVTLRGRIVPAPIGAPVRILRDGAAFATATSGRDGTLSTRLRAGAPATYSAQAGELASAGVALAVWYPMCFTGGFAIHSYPAVSAYPASHGCVRVPMWVAPRLFATNPWGETVYVYW